MTLISYDSTEANEHRSLAVCGGAKCEFFDCRLDPVSLPEVGKFMYELCSIEGMAFKSTLELKTDTGFVGTVVSSTQLIPEGKERLILNETRFQVFYGVDPDDAVLPIDIVRSGYKQLENSWSYEFTELGRMEDLLSDIGIQYTCSVVIDGHATPLVEIVMSDKSGPRMRESAMLFELETGKFVRFN